jgi:hypothetical protein
LRWCDNGRGIDYAYCEEATSDIGHTYSQMKDRTVVDLSRKGLGFKHSCWKLFSQTIFFNKTREFVDGESFIVRTVGLLPRPKKATGDDYVDGAHVLIPWDIQEATFGSMTAAIYGLEKPARVPVVVKQLEGLNEIFRQEWMFSGDEDDEPV